MHIICSRWFITLGLACCSYAGVTEIIAANVSEWNYSQYGWATGLSSFALVRPAGPDPVLSGRGG